jgi:hypothetical protein
MPSSASRDLLLRGILLALAAPAAGCRKSEPEKGPEVAIPSASGTQEHRAQATPLASAATARAFVCANPKPLIEGGVNTGFEECQGGAIHRPAIHACGGAMPRPDHECKGTTDGCRRDADCKGPHEYCGYGGSARGLACTCVAGCQADADCGAGQVCLCEGNAESRSPTGRCVKAACQRDADCASGPCLATPTSALTNEQYASLAFACQSPQDECATDADCPSHLCVLTAGKRSCQPRIGLPGRALTVGDSPRLARLRSDQGASW